MFEIREGDRVVTKKNPNGHVTRYILDQHDKPVAKKCTGCLEVKGLEQFDNTSRNKFYGRVSKCKKCVAEHAKKYREANKERIVEYQKNIKRNTMKKTKNESLNVVERKNPNNVRQHS